MESLKRSRWPRHTAAEFPACFPGTENDHVAYTNPGHGRVPERAVEGDYVMVPTYTVGSSIDYLLRYARRLVGML